MSMGKKVNGVKVPKRIMGFKLRKGTRKDIAAVANALGHPDAKSLVLAAMAALGPFLAERLVHKGHKLKAVQNG
jgi:hypothetical protein